MTILFPRFLFNGSLQILFSIIVVCLVLGTYTRSISRRVSLSKQNVNSTLSSNDSDLEACLDAYSRLTSTQYSTYVDASGKPGSGILTGNNRWFGSYSQCKKQSSSRYCLSTFPAVVYLQADKHEDTTLQWGVCVPRSCTEKGIKQGFDFILHNVSKIPVRRIKSQVQVRCDEDAEYTAGAILTIVFCGFISSLCLLATILEGMQDSVVVSEDKPNSNNPGELSIDQKTNEKMPLISAKSQPRESLKESKSRFYDAINCFSLIRNSNAIFNTKVPPNDLTYLHGIRVITMFWIILLHFAKTAAMRLLATDNIDDVLSLMRRFLSMIFINGALGVDTFFVLSGLLVAYVNLYKLNKSNGKMNWVRFYFHRFWRLTPTFMFIILIVAKLLPHFGQGPLWDVNSMGKACSKYWWAVSLYINNFYTRTSGCLGHTWFLAVDMQLFIFSPLLFLVGYRYGMRTIVLLSSLLIFASMIATGSVVAAEDSNPWHDITRPEKLAKNDFVSDVYIKPYSHAQSYIIGVLFGYFLHKFVSRQFKLSLVQVIILWILALGFLAASIYSPYNAVKNHNPGEMSRAAKFVYAALRYSLWSVGIVWIIFACHYGYAGLLKNILSARFWIPLSRMNYASYIVHVDVITVLVTNVEASIHYTTFTLVVYFLAVVVLCYACGFLVAVAIEFPCANLEALMLKSKKTK